MKASFKVTIFFCLLVFGPILTYADGQLTLLEATRVFDGERMHSDWVVLVEGDAIVYAHGDNVRELELMVEYGMSAIAVLRSATSVNADLFHIGNKVGGIRVGMLADIIAVEGDPAEDISNLRNIRLVMRGGEEI